VGQILNLQSLANDVGISHTTARSWISILEAGFIVFLLPPWFRNVSKRLIKSPKLYFCDVGLAGYLLGLENERHVSRDPLRGNLFENIAVIEAMKYRFNRGLRSNLFFYRDSGGNEVDLIMEIGPDLFPVEIKAAETVISDSLKGLKKFAGLVSELPWGSGLLYGGSDIQIRSDVRIYPLTKIHDMLASLA
jgi:predicted AAA+ superfamily ATPase